MENEGLHQYRLSLNHKEETFAREWEAINLTPPGRVNGRGVLDYLLAEDPNRPLGEATDRDRVVAATVIQWLGSPCGDGFLRNVMDIFLQTRK